jgi:hypothetical protein
MAVEGNLNRILYKILLYSVKVIPMIISGIYLLNTVLSYCNIDIPLFSYIVQFLFIGFFYIASYAFKFCAWHRMFIHYISLVLVLNIIDYHIGIPLSNRDVLALYLVISIVFLIVTVFLKFKVCKEHSKD